MIQQLQEKIAKLEAELQLYKTKCERTEELYEQLKSQVKELARNRFGSKTERYIDPEFIQLSLFDINLELTSPSLDESEDANSNVINIASHPRRKRGGRLIPQNLPRREVIIPLSEEDKKCACGREKIIIGYAISEVINLIPEIFEVIVEKREKAACPNKCKYSVVVAPKPKHILPKSKVSESFLANIIVSKIDDRQPLYHLEKSFKYRHGIDIPRNTMSHWIIESGLKLQPLVNLLQDQILDYEISALDATSLQVLKEPGRPPQRKSYAYCFRGGPPGREAILYEYNATEHKEFLKNWFADYEGTIHTDADPFFDDLAITPGIQLSYCNAHARRKFEPIAKAVQKEGLASHAMRVFRSLYKIERFAKDSNMNPEERKELRQQKSKPIMDEFKVWLDNVYQTVLPKSSLGNALAYCIRHWAGLYRFLDDGRLEIDNNLTEQEIKPFVIARKNFMFCNSVAGANALCVHFGLIRTAILNGYDPYAYYVKILKAIPYCETVEDYEALLPWNIDMQATNQTADIAA